jgi:hypothetical protein
LINQFPYESSLTVKDLLAGALRICELCVCALLTNTVCVLQRAN